MSENATMVSPSVIHTDSDLHDSVVAVYDNHAAAEASIRELSRSGFDMKHLSIVGKDYSTEESAVGFYNAGDRMKAWGKTGAFWGGLWGMFFGSALFVIPAVGPLFAAGPVVGWIVGALEGATLVGGLSALGAGLVSIGIPRDSIVAYETQIKAGKFLVVAHGARSQMARGKAILADAAYHNGVTPHCCE